MVALISSPRGENERGGWVFEKIKREKELLFIILFIERDFFYNVS